jgi:uncharacterized membrane protein YbhN (UPF0104 family)
MKSKFLYRLASLLGLLLFAGALWILYHELKDYSLHDTLQTLHNLAGPRLFGALALTLLSYLIMTGYDTLALSYIQHPLGYRKIALASFISYAMSNNLGLGMIAGGSVRYRLYSGWGLSPPEITKVLAFCTVTLWLGFVALAGTVFLFAPPALPKALALPFTTLRSLALLFLLVLGGYLTAAALIKKPLRIWDREFAFPSSRLLVTQLVVASLDWALAGMVLYTLLPGEPGLSYPRFLGTFLVAQMLGLLSQVPGGLGVFDTAVVVLLSSAVTSPAVLASLLAYRGIYYLLPLGVASAILAVQEFLRVREKLLSLAQFFCPPYLQDDTVGIGYDDVHRRGGSVVFRCHAGSTLAPGLAQDLPALAGTGNLPLSWQHGWHGAPCPGPRPSAPTRRRFFAERRPPSFRYPLFPAQGIGL